jgi:hypothetical protein
MPLFLPLYFIILGRWQVPEPVNPADIGMGTVAELEAFSNKQIARNATEMAYSGMSLKHIATSVEWNKSLEELLELISTYQSEEIELYKTTYRGQDVTMLNSWLNVLASDIRDSRVSLKPALIGAGLKVLEMRTKLLNEMTGLTKPGLTINYSIEGVDLNQV